MLLVASIKQHLRIEGDDHNLWISEARSAAIDHLTSIDVDMSADPLPPALNHAALLLIGHFFENREATTVEQLRFIPIGVDRLIAPYREVSF